MPTPARTSATGPPGPPETDLPAAPLRPPAEAPPQGAEDGLGPGPGVETAYYAFRVGGPEGRAVGVFRVAKDDDAQVLVMERFSTDGTWVDDPTLIDDMREPGVYAIDEAEAESIQAEILAAAPEQPPEEETQASAPAPPV